MIVPYELKCRKALIEICWRTGFYGRDLTGTDLFHDKEVFALCFCLHYVEFAPELAYIALDETGKAIGYVLGAADTRAGVDFVAGDIRLDYLGAKDRFFLKFDALAEDRANGTVLQRNSTSLGNLSGQ